MNKLVSSTLFLTLCFLVTSCEKKKGEAEKAGEKLDRMVEEMQK